MVQKPLGEKKQESKTETKEIEKNHSKMHSVEAGRPAVLESTGLLSQQHSECRETLACVSV